MQKQLRQFFLCNVPDDIKIHAKILMDKPVSHPGNIFPGNFWVIIPDRLGKIFRGLSDYLKISDNSILRFLYPQRS